MTLGPVVMLATEGGYPYHRSGVSSWCDALTGNLSEVNFTILALTAHPYLPPRYELPPNVREVITLPLFGTEDPAEYGRHDSLIDYLRRRWSTTTDDVQEDFVPSYRQLLREVVAPAIPARSLGLLLLRLHQHLRAYDWQRTQTHPAVWEAFIGVVQRAWRRSQPQAPPPSLAELVDAWRLFSRLLLPLAADPPRADLTHAVSAGFCGLPCVIQKLRWGTPYLLTEHDVYLRAQYLKLSAAIDSLFVRWFLLRVIATVVDINYGFADQVSPVCEFNAKWGASAGVERSRIRVIATGVDPVKFSPAPAQIRRLRPRVASVAHARRRNGQSDLIEAAALVRETMPDVEYRLYGSHDETCVRDCRDRIGRLVLDDHVTFAGTPAEPWSAYRDADVVVLPGAPEGFPFALLEAMMTGSAIVAADGGEVREVLGESGLIVRPNDPAAFAEAIVTLLQSSEERRTLGEQARERALRRFTEQQFVDAYRRSYARLLLRQLELGEASQDDDDNDDRVIPLLGPARAFAGI